MVVLTATQQLFTNSFFSISKLREIADLIEAPTKGDAWTLLQALHCVNYVDMPPMLREAIPHLVNECLMAHKQVAANVYTALNGVDL